MQVLEERQEKSSKRMYEYDSLTKRILFFARLGIVLVLLLKFVAVNVFANRL